MNDTEKNIEPTIELSKHLYHYTSQEGLLGILQTNKLRMTNILYLNDSSEFTHTLDLVKSELENRVDQLPKEGIPAIFKWENVNIDVRKFYVYNDLLSHFDFTQSETGHEVYVFSFSREQNDLSQWRGYCPKGVGFCIEFETDKISFIIEKTTYRLIECLYEKEEKEKIVKTLFDKLEPLLDSSSETKLILNDFKTRFNDPEISDKEMIEFLHYFELLEVSSYIKYDSFYKEQEHRIVHEGSDVDEIKYREGKSMVIPYIEFSPLDDDNKLPISKIIVGPTPHPELSKLSVKSLLESNGYKNVEVEISKIPYRSW